MRLVPVLLALVISSCAPQTGDELVDRVVADVDPFGSCVVLGHTRITKGPELSPITLQPSSFKKAEVRAAAELAATPSNVVFLTHAFFGEGKADQCGTEIGKPVQSGEYAFVEYRERGGTLGAIAFERDGSGWKTAEKVTLGFW